jgi:hypothetical protein
MKKIKLLLLTIGLLIGIGATLIPAYAGAAIDPLPSCSGDAADTVLCKDKDKKKFNDVVQTIVNTLLFILGAVCVIVIIIAGITYTTSGGDAALVTKAKNTLLYAIVGLIVAILAYPIVNYIIGAFAG